MLRYPCILGDPQQRGIKSKVAALPLPSWGPKRGRKCYVTPAFSGAQKRAEGLRHPCIPGDPQQRGTKSEMALSPLPSRGPKRGRESATSPLRSRGSPAGDENKSGPQKGGSATSPLRSRGPQTRGTKSEMAASPLPSGGPKKRAEMLHHPCIVADPPTPSARSKIRSGPQQRGTKSQVAASPLPSWGPKRGRICYVTPAFSGIPNKGEQNHKWLPHPCLLRGPKEGRYATSPLRSRGSPTVGDENKSGPQKGGSATSPLRSRGSPNKGTKSKVAHKWAKVLRNAYILGGPRKAVQKWPAPGSWKKSHSGGP